MSRTPGRTRTINFFRVNDAFTSGGAQVAGGEHSRTINFGSDLDYVVGRHSLRAGIRIFRYQPGFLHQKVVLIDSVAAAIGSANLDNRSFRLNFEIMVLTVDRGFARDVEAMLLKDFAESLEIDRTEYRNASALRRVLMHVARLFSPIL